MKVVMVDDDDIFLMIQSRSVVLGQLCTKPVCINDSAYALAYLLEDMQQIPPEPYLLLLDINMPKLNGWQLMDALIAGGAGDRLMVAIVSSSINEADKQKASTYPQIVSFIEKPMLQTHVAALKEICSAIS